MANGNGYENGGKNGNGNGRALSTWLQLVLAAVGAIVVVVWSVGQMRSDSQASRAEMEAEIQALKQHVADLDAIHNQAHFYLSREEEETKERVAAIEKRLGVR